MNSKLINMKKIIFATSTLLLLGASCSRYTPNTAPALAPIAPTGPINTITEPVKTTSTPAATTTVPTIVTTTLVTPPNLLAQTDERSEPTALNLFATSTAAFYFQRELDGMGGYIIFNVNQNSLIRVDRFTGEMKTITTKTKFTAPEDVMSDDSLIAYVVSEDPRGKGIATVEPKTGLQKFYPITPPAPFTLLGDVRFSPDGTEVAFAMAVGDPDHEQGAVYRLNLATGKTTRVATTKAADNTYFNVTGWTPQNTVIYR